MKPNPDNRVLSEDRRLNHGQKPVSKWAAKAAAANNGRDEVRRSVELEKSRNELAVLLDQYITILTDKTLPENRSVQDIEAQTKLMDGLPKIASELNKRNVEEGSMVIASTTLNSILVLKGEINKLRYQNYFLNKEMKDLGNRLKVLETQPAKEVEKVQE